MPVTGTEFTVVTDQVPSALSPVPCCTEALCGAGMAWLGLAAYGPRFVSLPRLLKLSPNQTRLLSTARLASPKTSMKTGGRLSCKGKRANKLIIIPQMTRQRRWSLFQFAQLKYNLILMID